MPQTKTADTLLNIVIPLLLGVMIYRMIPYVQLPLFFKNHFPDACWAYAFISAMLIVWDRKVHPLWIVAVFMAAVGYEVLQFVHILPGTGDVRDIVVYFTAFGVGLLANQFLRPLYTPSIYWYE